MPLQSDETLRRWAGEKGKTQAAKVQAATGQLHGLLARSHRHVAKNVTRLEAVIAAADAKHADLCAQLPELRAKADSAVGEERDVHHRNYLRAVSHRNACTRVHGAAKRELIIARNL
jgi:hypothetical protein